MVNLRTYLANFMKILIQTKVDQSHHEVFSGFNEQLFLALKPPLLPLQLLRFDGCVTGDEVHIMLGKGVLSQRWDAKIVDHGKNENEYFFVDKGVQLPFFLKKWTHRHRIVNNDGKGSIIIDDIDYHTPNVLFDYLMYPIMYLQFWMRSPVYKRVFQ